MGQILAIVGVIDKNAFARLLGLAPFTLKDACRSNPSDIEALMRFPRMTIRRWMIAVAVIAVVLGRWIDFRNRADHHRRERARILMSDLEFYLACTHAQGDPSDRAERAFSAAQPLIEFSNYHSMMIDKYENAFWHPWLWVPRDPPAPAFPSKEYQKAFRVQYLDPFETSSNAPGPPLLYPLASPDPR
jgi:hypothetical protein